MQNRVYPVYRSQLWVRQSPSQEALPELSCWSPHSAALQLESGACVHHKTNSETSGPTKTNLLNAPTAGSAAGGFPTRTVQSWWHPLLFWSCWFMVSNTFSTWVFPLAWTLQPHHSLKTTDGWLSVKAQKCNYPLTLLLIIDDCCCCLFFLPEVFTNYFSQCNSRHCRDILPFPYTTNIFN